MKRLNGNTLKDVYMKKSDKKHLTAFMQHTKGYRNFSDTFRLTQKSYTPLSMTAMGKYLCQDLEDNLRKNVAKGNGKARNTGFAIPVLGRLPKAFLDVYLLKCKLQMALRLLDIGTECSLHICIGKPCGGVRPLTVGHDDNVFLNGLAQQAIQKEIARLGIMPETLCSYQ
jgi:hypothetical protein